MLFQSWKGCIKQQHKHIPCPNAVLPNAPYNAANTSTRDTHKWDPKKKCSPNRTMWLIAFAGELGDVVSRPLPHGILDTSEDPQVGVSPKSLDCPQLFSICQGLSGEPGESGFVGSLPA